MSKHFELPESWKDLWIEKEIEFISEDSNVTLLVDFDDVDHDVVEELMKLIVPAINNIPEREWKAAVNRGKRKSAADE